MVSRKRSSSVNDAADLPLDGRTVKRRRPTPESEVIELQPGQCRANLEPDLANDMPATACARSPAAYKENGGFHQQLLDKDLGLGAMRMPNARGPQVTNNMESWTFRQITRLRSLAGDIATVRVGSQRSKFAVHEGLLSSYCDFFRSAFRGAAAYQESETLDISLPEHDPNIFELFVQWLYGPHDSNARFNFYVQMDGALVEPSIGHYARLYQLGDFLQCAELLRDITCKLTPTNPLDP